MSDHPIRRSEWAAHFEALHDGPARIRGLQCLNEPMLATLLASHTVTEITGRFRISPRNLARMRERLDL